jgi:hypothetical protein
VTWNTTALAVIGVPSFALFLACIVVVSTGVWKGEVDVRQELSWQSSSMWEMVSFEASRLHLDAYCDVTYMGNQGGMMM